MNPKPKEPKGEPDDKDEPLPNPAVDDFFSKMNHDFRRPKPSEEAVAAALQAIQTLAKDVALEEVNVSDPAIAPGDVPSEAGARAHCPKCGGVIAGSNRFCGYCGTLLDRDDSASKAGISSKAAVQEQHVHHHHHHYHHFLGSQSAQDQVNEAPPSPPVGLEPAEIASAESALKKLIQRWTMAHNAKRLDELVSLYSSEAIVLRPNTLPARGRPGVREYIAGVMQSGLGDMQLDCTDIGVLGELACLSGRNRMLVPVAAGNRQERTGKFLMVARREGAEWRILADVWCMDAVVTAAPPARAPRK